MAHYDCRECGAAGGIAPQYCDDCKQTAANQAAAQGLVGMAFRPSEKAIGRPVPMLTVETMPDGTTVTVDHIDGDSTFRDTQGKRRQIADHEKLVASFKRDRAEFEAKNAAYKALAESRNRIALENACQANIAAREAGWDKLGFDYTSQQPAEKPCYTPSDRPWLWQSASSSTADKAVQVPAGTTAIKAESFDIASDDLSLPDDDHKRGEYPMADGLLDYFPNALAEISRVSKIGNDQHNPGEPMYWARLKSTDHANKILRHLVDRGRFDGRGVRHTARLAWRALAMLQQELEDDEGITASRASRF